MQPVTGNTHEHHNKQPHLRHSTEQTYNCIIACWNARSQVQTTLFTHCLAEGGEHASEEHVRIMIDCMEICQSAADFMTRNSSAYRAVCAACSDVCDACADSCEKLDGKHMKECAEKCRLAARACDQMASNIGVI